MKIAKIVGLLTGRAGRSAILVRSIISLLDALREAEVARLRSDLAQLRSDLERQWRRFLGLVLLAAFVFGIVFWALGALLFAAGAGLAQVLPLWAAALTVAASLLVLAAVLLWIIRVRARRLESPVATVKRRIGDHVSFWRRRLNEAVESIRKSVRGVRWRRRGDAGDETPRDADAPPSR